MGVLNKLYCDYFQIVKLKLGAHKLGIKFIIHTENQQSGYLPHLVFRIRHQHMVNKKSHPSLPKREI